MFLLSNINDRNYKNIYPNSKNVIFDISKNQILNAKNSAWEEIKQGDIVCVVTSSRKISTFYEVSLKDNDPEDEETFLLHGKVIAKLEKETDMEILLNKFNVTHKYLPSNKFSIGFNVANLNDSLNDLLVKTRNGNVPLGTL